MHCYCCLSCFYLQKNREVRKTVYLFAIHSILHYFLGAVQRSWQEIENEMAVKWNENSSDINLATPHHYSKEVRHRAQDFLR